MKKKIIKPTPIPTIESMGRPMTSAEMATEWPVEAIAARGDGKVRDLQGNHDVELQFSPKHGEIKIKIGGKSAVVYKDELLYFARFAKGAQAV